MSATTDTRGELDALVAARLRGAAPDELLDLADSAIEHTSAAAADTVGLELIAAELDAAAAAHPETADGLRVAAARARAALPNRLRRRLPPQLHSRLSSKHRRSPARPTRSVERRGAGGSAPG